jgi:hypothetical protein
VSFSCLWGPTSDHNPWPDESNLQLKLATNRHATTRQTCFVSVVEGFCWLENKKRDVSEFLPN